MEEAGSAADEDGFVTVLLMTLNGISAGGVSALEVDEAGGDRGGAVDFRSIEPNDNSVVVEKFEIQCRGRVATDGEFLS